MTINDGFTQRKNVILQSLSSDFPDASKKGTVDEAAIPLIKFINSNENFVTTSSCSGRVAIYFDKPLSHNISHTLEKEETNIKMSKKKGGGWIFVSHDPLHENNVNILLGNNTYTFDTFLTEHSADLSLVTFKFEPFILHVEARTLEMAQHILSLSLEAGYRNSGIVMTGKSEKDNNQIDHLQVKSSHFHPSNSRRYMVALRCLLKLDAPIGYFSQQEKHIKLIVSQAYLETLITLANTKFKKNKDRMARLLELFHKKL